MTIDNARRGDRAERLRALHRPGDPVLLANIWDAASARVVQDAGFAAVATSSAAVARSLGYDDNEATPAGEMLDAVARIARSVAVPVTADLERGYGLAPAELVERVLATGVAGCNLEDSDPKSKALIDPRQQADFLAAVRDAVRWAGADLVINARIDVYLGGRYRPGAGPVEDRLAEAVRRAGLYLAAGADCVYPILAAGPDVAELVGRVGGPVNVMYRGGSPAIPELAAIRVARISLGGGLQAAAHAHLHRMVTAMGAGGDPYSIVDGRPPRE